MRISDWSSDVCSSDLVIFMRKDCQDCRSEGFTALTRVVVSNGQNNIVATLNVVKSEIIHQHEAGLSIEAMKRLGVKTGDTVRITHLKPIESFKKVRGKMYGNAFTEESLTEIINDIVDGRYSNIDRKSVV